MRATFQRFGGFALTALAAAMLVACGGGGTAGSEAAAAGAPETTAGSDTTTPGGGTAAGGTPTAPAAPVTLSGVAATGAAFEGARITVTDRTGAVVGTSDVVGADGKYTVTLAEGAQAPFVLVASRTTASGETQSLVSVADSAAAATVNVTPVTNLIAARLSPNGDPLALPAAVQAEPARVSAETVSAAVAEANTVLTPLLAATGTSVTVNPLTAPITTDGTGYDRLLDSMHVSVTPQADNSSRIEVTFKVQTTDPAAQPPAIQFSSTAPASELATQAAAVTLAASGLVPEGTTARIAEFLSRMTACYALPLEQRVNNATAGDAAVVGTAANVSATECRGLFVGNDPATFLNNGARVGRTAANGGAFAGLFRSGSMGVVFSQGAYDFTRANGDIVISYKWRDTSGAENFDSVVVRGNAESGKLAAIGNQYVYGGGVSPYHQLRNFIVPDSTGASQSGYDYSSTGYTLNVPNTVDGTGTPIFDRVVVTTPRGATMTLKPLAGVSFLVLVRADGTFASSTNYVRLRSRYADPATTGHPRDVDTGLFFVPTDLPDDEISAMSEHSVWKYDYFLAGNTGGTPDATQHYKTRARALSLGELSRKNLATLTAATREALLARPSFVGQVALPGTGPLTDVGYEVASGALPPTSIAIYGRMAVNGRLNGPRFNDDVGMASTARTANVSCQPATGADAHCSATTPGAFADGAYLNSLHLWAKEVTGREYARLYAIYRLR